MQHRSCSSQQANKTLGFRACLRLTRRVTRSEACPSPDLSSSQGKADSTVWNISKHKKRRPLPSLPLWPPQHHVHQTREI